MNEIPLPMTAMHETTPPIIRGTRIPARNLDVLRAIAVSCVFVDHVIARFYGEVPSLWRLGRVGVLLFFVHTSLVLMASLERHHESARNFFLRRAFRIYPLAMLTVIAVALRPSPSVLPVHIAPVPVTVGTLLANLTLTQNLFGVGNLVGVLWTLPLEIQMYLLLPLCFRVARRGVIPVVGMLLIAVLAGIIVQTDERLWRFSVANFGPCFIAGVLAYASLRQGKMPRLSAWTWPLLLMAGVLFVVPFPVLLPSQPATGWIANLVVGLLIPNVHEMADGVFTRLSATIAKYSYGVYLLHVPALAIGFGLGRRRPFGLQWILFAVAAIALPYLAYHFIEAPGIALGRRLIQRAWFGGRPQFSLSDNRRVGVTRAIGR
ncbi:MAG: acyltransferase [bacterium]